MNNIQKVIEESLNSQKMTKKYSIPMEDITEILSGKEFNIEIIVSFMGLLKEQNFLNENGLKFLEFFKNK